MTCFQNFDVVAQTIFTDAVIGISFLSIPMLLALMIWREVSNRVFPAENFGLRQALLASAGLFILLQGILHLLDIETLRGYNYMQVILALKVVCSVAAAGTVFSLVAYVAERGRAVKRLVRAREELTKE